MVNIYTPNEPRKLQHSQHALWASNLQLATGLPGWQGTFACYKNNFLTLHMQDPCQHLLVFRDAIRNGECSLIAFPPCAEKQTTVDSSPAEQWCYIVPRWLAFLPALSYQPNRKTTERKFCDWFQIASYWQWSPQWTTASRLTDGAKHRWACSEMHILEMKMQAQLGVSDPGLSPYSSIPISHAREGEPRQEIQRVMATVLQGFLLQNKVRVSGRGWMVGTSSYREEEAGH